MSVSVAPNSMRERYVFAHGIGWQAIALAASVMAQEAGSKWLNHLETTLGSISWDKANKDWQNVCMIGDRIMTGFRAKNPRVAVTSQSIP